MVKKRIFIITGPKNSGKSTFLGNIMFILREKGIHVAGIGTSAMYTAGEKAGFEMIDLKSGEKSILCHVENQENWEFSGKFYFNPETIKKGESALDPAFLADADMVVVDELGPLELKGGGWMQGINRLMEKSMLPMLVVVRQEILEESLIKFSNYAPVIYRVDQVSATQAGEDLIRQAISENH